jgi:hypothetical protein
MRDEGGHGATVDEWLARADGPTSSQLLQHFELAFHALWARTKTTLGEVTLTAITERVLHAARAKYPCFATAVVDPAVGVSCGGLRESIGTLPPGELRQGIRFVLVEFLVVLGNLTAEILTPELHAELSRLAPPNGVRVTENVDAPDVPPRAPRKAKS